MLDIMLDAAMESDTSGTWRPDEASRATVAQRLKLIELSDSEFASLTDSQVAELASRLVPSRAGEVVSMLPRARQLERLTILRTAAIAERERVRDRLLRRTEGSSWVATLPRANPFGK